MKKFYLGLLLLFLIVIPVKVNALEEGITNYYIDATVLENGDMHVKELFVLNGDFNGFERIINFRNPDAPNFNGSVDSFAGSDIYNGDSIDLKNIKNISIDNGINFNYLYHEGDEFERSSYAYVGEYGKYTVSNTSDGVSYKIYNPSNGSEKGFYVEYIIKNIGIMHNDVGEIGWNIFSDQLTEYVNNLEMIVNIPNNQDTLRVWGHGPLNGSTDLLGKDKIKLQISDLNPKTPIDIRFVFDKDVINKTSKMTNVDALDKILDIESQKAKQANDQRKLAGANEGAKEGYDNGYKDGYDNNEYNDDVTITKLSDEYFLAYKKNYIEQYKIGYEEGKDEAFKHLFIGRSVTVISILWLIGLGYVIYRVYNKYDKEYTSTFKTKYYRDFPATYGPEIVGYLFKRKISNHDLSAAILNLIAKKVVTFEEEKRNNYILKYDEQKAGKEKLTAADKHLIKWMFEEIGDNNSVSMKEIKKEAKKNYSGFLSSYNLWKDLVLDEAKNEKFYETNFKIKVLSSLYSVFGFLLVFIAINYPIVWAITIAVAILSVISLIYFITLTKRTRKGNEDYNKWKGLKNFLKDFGKFKGRDLPHINLWEKYLVYAVTFGCAKKLSKTMEIKFKELNASNYTATDAMFDLHYIHVLSGFNRTLNTSMNDAVSSAISARTAATSRSSSAGGFGGGFSGGGGSFGGGGGGGRF